MRRLPILLLLIATTAVAQVRSRATMPVKPDVSGNTVSGVVSSVSGPFILLAGGLVTIDTTGAKIAGDAPEAGLMVFAVLKPGEVAPNAPLPAAYVGVTRLAQVSLGGPVTAVDLGNSTLTLLGRTIKVTSSTAISGLMTFKAMTLADIFPGQTVQVEANTSGGALVAASIHVMTMHPVPVPSVIHGTVKSISNDLWVINAQGKDVSVTVNAQTKIVGDPKIGDTVDVLITGDNVALSILKAPVILPIPKEMRITGFVKSIATTVWTVGLGPEGSKAPEFRVEVNAHTKIAGDPKVGDRVEVVGTMGHGSMVASSITKVP